MPIRTMFPGFYAHKNVNLGFSCVNYLCHHMKECNISGACGVMREKGNTKRILVVKHERKIPLGRPGLKLEDNIKMDFKVRAQEGIDLIIWLRTGASCGCCEQ
jgi:hypothetical protein